MKLHISNRQSLLYFGDDCLPLCTAAVAHEIERFPTNRKVSGLIPCSSSPHTEVSLGKIVNPNLPLMCVIGVWMYMNVLERTLYVEQVLCEWVNLTCSVKYFGQYD